jgi:hypothetical protein
VVWAVLAGAAVDCCDFVCAPSGRSSRVLPGSVCVFRCFFGSGDFSGVGGLRSGRFFVGVFTRVCGSDRTDASALADVETVPETGAVADPEDVTSDAVGCGCVVEVDVVPPPVAEAETETGTETETEELKTDGVPVDWC